MGAIIHITGASGTGTTTLAKAICKKYGYIHLDTDDYFWEATDPPFTVKRERVNRQRLLGKKMDTSGNCVISGSLIGWGDMFIPKFDLVVYVYTATDIRLKRLYEREFQKFGERILPGGDMHVHHEEFMKWATDYDTAGMEKRSAKLHREWLKGIVCPIVELDGTIRCEDNQKKIEKYIQQFSIENNDTG